MLVAGLGGCSSGSDPFVRTVRNLTDIVRAEEPRATNPLFSYIRMVVNGRVAILARGNIESGPDGLVEVWYSADRAVLHLRDGRVAGAFGFSTEWRRVVQPDAPAWREAAGATAAAQWVRVRDVMPGYQVGVRDTLNLQRIAPPGESALVNVAPDSLIWFEESTMGGNLPPARYAMSIGSESVTVVYGEQCLSPEFCFSWQRWTATPPAQ